MLILHRQLSLTLAYVINMCVAAYGLKSVMFDGFLGYLIMLSQMQRLHVK